MKKKRLSEIPVNAASLGGQTPDYYNFRLFGLGAPTNSAAPIVDDYNKNLNTGFYSVVSSAQNKPSDLTGTPMLIHLLRAVDSHATQIAIGSSSIHVRSKVSGVWGEWVKV